MELTQSSIMGLLKNKRTLSYQLSEIENYFSSDVISYFGLIEKVFIEYLLDLAKQTQKKSGRKRLTIILMSRGGLMHYTKLFYEAIYKIYNELYIVGNEKLGSAATIFSFFGDKLFLFDEEERYGTRDTVSFGMIDPQLPAFLSDGVSQIFISAFYHIGGFRFEYELKDTDDLSTSFVFSHPQSLLFDNPICKQAFESIFNCRNLAFDALVKHNLKNEADKNKKAISIINFLMNVNKHCSHESLIFPKELKAIGLCIERFPENENKIIDVIKGYNETILKILDIEGNFYSISGNCGNKLQCLIQSVDDLVI